MSITETLRAPDFWTAHFHGDGSLSEEQEAAPFEAADLLEELVNALEKALYESGCDGDLCFYDWHEAARAAIAKAKP